MKLSIDLNDVQIGLLRQGHGREEMPTRAACHENESLHSAGASGATALL